MQGTQLRDITASDHLRIYTLNEFEVQWTSPMDEARLRELLEVSSHNKVVIVNEAVAGFIIAMTNDSRYGNANLDWFRERYERLLYIDRVVVDSELGGSGLGRLLYEDAISVARSEKLSAVVCEDNLEPLNQGSKHFHEKMGFCEVGQQRVGDSQKLVSMQALNVASARIG